MRHGRQDNEFSSRPCCTLFVIMRQRRHEQWQRLDSVASFFFTTDVPQHLQTHDAQQPRPRFFPHILENILQHVDRRTLLSDPPRPPDYHRRFARHAESWGFQLAAAPNRNVLQDPRAASAIRRYGLVEQNSTVSWYNRRLYYGRACISVTCLVVLCLGRRRSSVVALPGRRKCRLTARPPPKLIVTLLPHTSSFLPHFTNDPYPQPPVLPSHMGGDPTPYEPINIADSTPRVVVAVRSGGPSAEW